MLTVATKFCDCCSICYDVYSAGVHDLSYIRHRSHSQGPSSSRFRISELVGAYLMETTYRGKLIMFKSISVQGWM
jgi:hypothetical protein